MTVGSYVTNDGRITVDATSTLTVGGTTTNSGTITVDATGFAGDYKKILDLNGLSGNAVQVTGLSDGVTALYGYDGDVSLTTAKVAFDTIHVDTAWAGKYELGDAVDEDKQLLYGINAFGDIENLSVAAETTAIDIVVHDGEELSFVYGYSTFGATQTVTMVVEAGGKLVYDPEKYAERTEINLYNDSTATFAGTAEAAAQVTGNHLSAALRFVLHDNATFTAVNSDLQLAGIRLNDASSAEISDTLLNSRAVGVLAEGASMVLDNTAVLAQDTTNYGTLSLVNGTEFTMGTWNYVNYMVQNYGELTIDDSTFNSTKGFNNNGSLVLDNGAVLNNVITNTTDNLTGTATCYTYTGEFHNTADGTIAILDESAITAEGTLDNAGAIELDATSTLAVGGATTNTGAITLDATGFTDSYKKVVDLNGLTGNDVAVENLESGVNAIHTLDGDVALTSADMNLVKVDAAWSGQFEDGAAVDEDEAFLYNVNAYGDIDEAANTENRVADVAKVQILSGDHLLTQQLTEWKADLEIANGAGLSYDGSLDFGGADVALAGSANLSLTGDASFGGALALIGDADNQSLLTADGALALTGTAALAADTAAITAGSMTVAAGATVDLDNATVTVAGEFASSGAIAMNLTDTITVGSFSGKSGSITVDMTGASQLLYTLVDVTGDGAMTLADFGKVTLSNKEYEAVVNGNDLAAACISTIKVNNAWDAASVLPEGYFWGVNAFSTVEAATAAAGWGTRTYEITRDVDSRMTLSVSMDKGTASVTVGEADGKSLASFLVAGSKKQVVEMKAGKTYEITMDGSNLEYDFKAEFQDVRPNTDKAITITADNPSYTDADGHVGYGSGAQNYTFSVAESTSGSYTFAFATNDDRISYTVSQVVKGVKKTLVSGSTTGSASRTLNLSGGDYVIAVNSYDNGAGAYESDFTMTVDAEIATDVSADDDKPILNDTTGKLKSLSLDSSETSGFVGYGDKTDYIAIDTQDQNGKFSFELTVAEGTAAKGLKFVLVQYDGKKETTVKSVSFAGSKTTIADVTLDRTKKYFLKLDVASASTTSKNATYNLKMSGTVAADNTKLSSDDDAWNSAYVKNNAYTGGTYENWVGTEDRLDYVKLDLSTGTNTLRFLTNDAKRVAVTIYKVASGKSSLSTVKSLNLYTGKTVDYKLSVAAKTDYYIRFQSVAGTNVSSNYSMALA